MDIYVYSDESGVFDRIHNEVFVYGGLLFLNKEKRDECSRKFSAAEKCVKASGNIPPNIEVKASNISNKHKASLFRSLNAYYKFGIVVRQTRVISDVFANKKSKQRYLDYAFKTGLKRFLEFLILSKAIEPASVNRMFVFADEHTTATDGRYELGEALKNEFKTGTFDFEYNTFYPPLFSHMQDVSLTFCNSSSTRLVRAADIIANKGFYWAKQGCPANKKPNLFIHCLP